MQNKVLMFAYGTLRPGQYNADRFHGVMEVVAQNVTTMGCMKAVSRHGGYPVVDAFGDGAIVGDVLRYDADSPKWRHIVQMETGAGYVPVIINVSDNRDGNLTCIIWHYPDFQNPRLGDIIPGGDWLNSGWED